MTLPYLRPAMIGAALVAFLMSFENFNTTLMLVGSDPPLTITMFDRMKQGSTPVLNAVSLFLMVASAAIALVLMRAARRARLRRRFATVTAMPTDTELCFTPARKLARMIRARKLSATEVMRAFIAQIERVNPQGQRHRHLPAGARR